MWPPPIASTSRQVGGSLGVAVIGAAVVSGVTRRRWPPGFAEASHTAWWIMAACGLGVLGLGLLTTGRWARATAERTAAAIDRTAPPAPAVVGTKP